MTRSIALAWMTLAILAIAPASADQETEPEPLSRDEAIARTLASLRKELDAHGGSWGKWGESIEDYREDVRPYLTDWKTFKWPWAAKKGYVFQGAAIKMHLRDTLAGLPEGERPLESIVRFDRQLKSLGIDLIMAFIPAKLSVYPDYLYAAVKDEPKRAARAPADWKVSVATKWLMTSLLQRDVEVVDLHGAFHAFRKAHGDDKPTWYQRDSHFLNRGARLTARKIAERLRRYDFVQEALKDGNRYTGKSGARTDGSKADSDVLYIRDKKTGRPYRDVGDSPVVISGDSYPIYNQPTGHLAAQVAHLIGLPVTMKARVGLSATIPVTIARDRRLDKRRVIVCVYSERSLAPNPGKSKWPLVRLPGAEPPAVFASTLKAGTLATGVVSSASQPPNPRATYPYYVMTFHLTKLTTKDGKPVGEGDAVVAILAMRDRKVLPIASAKRGDKLTVRLTPWEHVQKEYGSLQTGTLEDIDLELEKTRYWGQVPGQPALTDEELKRAGEEDAPRKRAAADAPGKADAAGREKASATPKSKPKPPRHPNSEGPGSWFWPMKLNLPAGVKPNERRAKRLARMKAEGKLPILVWIPPGAKRIRAVLLISSNTDSMAFGCHKAVREVTAKHKMGIVYTRYNPHAGLMEKLPPAERKAHLDAADQTLRAILNKVAERAGIPEFRHAPLIPLGKSSCGRFPMNIAWFYPDRVAAAISWHGEVPHWPTPEWAKLGDQSILYINVNGQHEWSGTWYRHVRPNLLNYRRHTNWLPHQVVSRGVGHGNYPDETSGRGDPTPRMRRAEVWDYMALWLDKALQARLPEDAYPTHGPVKLRQVDPDSGYLIHPRAIEELLGTKWFAFREKDGTYQIIPWPEEKHPVYDTEQGRIDRKLLVRKATDVPEAERKRLLWVPDREVAQAWLRLHAAKGESFDIP